MRTHGITKPWAREFIASALLGRGGRGTLLKVYQEDVDITHTRNENEILAWCRVIDAMRLGQHEVALELAVRRLAGVHSAELSGTWKVSDVFELDTRKTSFVPPGVLKHAIKTVNRAEKLKKLGEKSSSSGSSAATVTRRTKVTTTERKPSSSGGADASNAAARPTKPPLRK
jgi:hypothetical protein